MEVEEALRQMKELQEFFGEEEELHPDLQAYYTAEPFPCIRHPLVYSIFHDQRMNALVNKQLKAKWEATEAALDEEKYDSYIWLHEKPYRLDAFFDIEDNLSDEDYWRILREVWSNSENIWQNRQSWSWAWTSDRPGRELAMNQEERDVLFKDLPDEVTIYRGWNSGGTEMGMSWTTNPIVAKFFARRFIQEGERGYVTTGTVKKRHVLSFIDSRSEYEIVVVPHKVKIIEDKEVVKK